VIGEDTPAPSDNPRRVNPVDVHVGNRLRLRRMLIGMSQEQLGEQMGLTFQQIQKYEKGVNRIGASRLFRLSQVLSVPVQFFYDELTVAKAPQAGMAAGFAEPAQEHFILDFLNTREGLELNRHFVKIEDPKVRRSVVDLVRSLSGSVPSE
jgi:transcriptional regulator with XRE-family HTH domain